MTSYRRLRICPLPHTAARGESRDVSVNAMVFADRLAVVTGAASGIGRSTVCAFADRGAEVLAVDIDPVGLEALAGPHITTATADVRRPGEVGKVLGGLPRIDALANVAGSYAAAGLANSSAELLCDLFDINVTGTTVCTQAALPLLATAHGAVVNVASTVGHRASATASGYAASKAAVEHLTRCWAVELAPRDIRVNAVAPGPVETPILANSGMSAAAIDNQRRAEIRRIPQHRLGSPAEIARWIVALAAPASWITGAILCIDGGLSCA